MRVEQTWWAVDRANVRWQVVTKPPRRRPRRASKRTLPLSDFFKIFHLLNFEIQNSDIPSVQISPNFA
jgi:hypothetical protein